MKVKTTTLLCLLGCASLLAAADESNLLKEPLTISNPATTTLQDGVYTVVNPDPKTISRITQTVELNQTAAKPITFALEAWAEDNQGNSGCYFGAVLNLIHTDGSRTNGVNFGMGSDTFPWHRVSRTYQPVKAVKTVEFIVQYIRNRGKVHFRNPLLAEGVVNFKPLQAAPEAAKADPVTRLGKVEITVKDRNLATVLLRGGEPTAAIVGDATLAATLNEALKRLSGSELPVLPHTAYENAEELDRHLIVIGNRDRNRSISNLYNRHFTLLDARYPGKGGNEVRSLHNPFGDKFNVILAGGSDAAGDAAAVAKLIGHLEKAAGKHGELTLGFLSDVTLSPDYEVARDVKDIPLWEESAGYGNAGYFGWNSLAKNLAMLYITNDPYYKDEFMRLAFPKDKATQDELFTRDDEAYHDRTEPIVKVYHYRGQFMLLYWDLVDENPLFSDAERRQVTQKIYELLVYRLTRNDYTNPYRRYDEYKLVRPGRHTAWEVLLVYTAARYLHKDYPSFDTAEGLRLGKNAMEPLYTVIINGHIPLYWMNTSTELQLYYAVLQGHRYVDHPALRDYARNLSLLSDLGLGNDDPNSRFTSLWTLLAGAYLAQDQALIEMLQNKKKAGMTSNKVFDLDKFRLGQSFWPIATYPRDSVRENLGKWNFYRTAKPSAPQETELQYLSYRSAPDRSGDYLLVDTRFDLGIREPQHNFALVNATLAGTTLLRGFENALTPFGNNLADLTQPFGSDIISSGSVGPYCWVTGLVKDFNGFDWQRTWLAKRGDYLLAADTLTAVRDLASARLDNRFASPFKISSTTPAGNGDFRLQLKTPDGAREYTLSTSVDAPAVLERSTLLNWQQDTDALQKGAVLRLVSIVRPGAPLQTPSAAHSGTTAALATPRPTLWKWTADGFVLQEPDATLTVTENVGQLGDSDAAATQQAEQLLAARPASATTPAPLASAPLPVRWRQEVAPYAGVSCLFDGKAAIASGKTLRLIDLANGDILWQRDVSDIIGRLAWWPQAELLLTGCRDEKLYGWDAKGDIRWTFTSEMAPEMHQFGPYHHKSAVPGIRSILPRGDLLYVGSAGTLEVLNRQGQLQKRLYVLYGPIEELIPMPDSDDVLIRRLVSGTPALHRVTPELTISSVGWNRGLQDDLGSFGFSQVSQQFVLFFRNAQNELRVANVFNGVQNRLVLRDAAGKALNEVNFGTGGTAASANLCYDRPALINTTMRNAAIADLDQDGTPEIVVATANGKLYLFDPQLTLRRILTLPAEPRTLAVADGELFFGLNDGSLVRLTAQDGLQLVGQLSGAVLTLDRVGEHLLAGSAKGELLMLTLRP
jgi:outer membrane protein assembly factor BamB